MWGDDLGLREGAVGEVVQLRRAGAVAGEVEGDQAVQPGVGAEVVAGEVEVLGNLPLMLLRARPVLAEQRPLVRQLPGIVGGEAHAVTGGEEQRRGVLAP